MAPARARWSLLPSVGWMFLGQSTTSAVRFLALFVIARAVGPAGFAAYAIYISTLALTATAANFGLDTTCVRFAAQIDDPPAQFAVLRKFCLLRLLTTACAVGALAMLSEPVCVYLLTSRAYLAPFRMACLGAGVVSLAAFAITILQSRSEFTRITRLKVMAATAQAVPLIAALGGRVSVGVLLAADILGGLIVIGGCVPLLSKILLGPRIGGSVPSTWVIFRFARWITASIAAGSLYNYVPTLVLTRLSSQAELGEYVLGFMMANVITVIMNATTSVFLPEAAKATSAAARRAYLKSATAVAAAICVPVGLAVAVAPTIVRSTGLAERFAPALSVFLILAAAQLVLLMINPAQCLFYSWDRPVAGTITDATITIGFFVLAYCVAPGYGAVGVACALLVVQTTVKALVMAGIYVANQRELGVGQAA
jgi:O-antigen/teichoic acid export membrane protein